MKKDKYLKRIINVLPFRLRWLISKNNHTEYIYPETIDEFFNWYMNEKRICLFMDYTIKPVLIDNYYIVDIDYELQETGSYFTYTLINKLNTDERINYNVRIRNGYLEIVRKTTQDNFTKKYLVTIIGEYSELNSDIDKLLFNSLKTLMYNSLLIKLDVVYSQEYKKEDIYEAIPNWLT